MSAVRRQWTDPHCGYNPSICPWGDMCADCTPQGNPFTTDHARPQGSVGGERMFGTGDPLEGAIVCLPSGDCALVLTVEHEYDDGTTLRYMDGPYAGDLTMRDTYAVRKWPVEWPVKPR